MPGTGPTRTPVRLNEVGIPSRNLSVRSTITAGPGQTSTGRKAGCALVATSRPPGTRSQMRVESNGRTERTGGTRSIYQPRRASRSWHFTKPQGRRCALFTVSADLAGHSGFCERRSSAPCCRPPTTRSGVLSSEGRPAAHRAGTHPSTVILPGAHRPPQGQTGRPSTRPHTDSATHRRRSPFPRRALRLPASSRPGPSTSSAEQAANPAVSARTSSTHETSSLLRAPYWEQPRSDIGTLSAIVFCGPGTLRTCEPAQTTAVVVHVLPANYRRGEILLGAFKRREDLVARLEQLVGLDATGRLPADAGPLFECQQEFDVDGCGGGRAKATRRRPPNRLRRR